MHLPLGQVRLSSPLELGTQNKAQSLKFIEPPLFLSSRGQGLKIWGQGLKPWRWLSLGSMENERESAQSKLSSGYQKKPQLWAGLKTIEKKLGPEKVRAAGEGQNGNLLAQMLSPDRHFSPGQFPASPKKEKQDKVSSAEAE